MAAPILNRRIAFRTVDARLRLNLKQEEAAAVCGLHRNTLNRIEHAKGCSVESLYRLARGLNLNLDNLLEFRKPATSQQLELWPIRRRKRPYYARRKSVQGDRSRRSDDLFLLPVCVGSQRS